MRYPSSVVHTAFTAVLIVCTAVGCGGNKKDKPPKSEKTSSEKKAETPVEKNRPFGFSLRLERERMTYELAVIASEEGASAKDKVALEKFDGGTWKEADVLGLSDCEPTDRCQALSKGGAWVPSIFSPSDRFFACADHPCGCKKLQDGRYRLRLESCDSKRKIVSEAFRIRR